MYNSAKVNNLAQPVIGDAKEIELITAAQEIYETYYRLHYKVPKDPLGVAVHPKTGRGQLLFTKKPILLPGERFIPIRLLQEVKPNHRYQSKQ